MRLISWKDIFYIDSGDFSKGTALTIGSFDGPHKGHEKLFESVLSSSSRKNLIPGIITFSRALPALKHPLSYAGDIATLEQRLKQYEKKGFQFAVVVDFDQQFMSIKGEDFFDILSDILNLKHLTEGVDFRCGNKGLFGMEEIKALSEKKGFETDFIDLVKTEGQRVSSSIIRNMIQEGKFKEVNQLLERNFTLINCMKTEQDSGNIRLIPRSNFSQVMPENGKFNVKVNGKFPCAVEFSQNEVKISGFDAKDFPSEIDSITF